MKKQDVLPVESWSEIIVVRDESRLLGFIAIHRGNKKHPAFGATRIASYPNMPAALNDALDLSWLMSHKAALAGLPYGGGKGVLFDTSELRTKDGREHALKIYAGYLNRLDGRFITGSDAGVEQGDVHFLKQHSPHIVGVQEDPTKRTADGLLGSIKVILMHLFNDPDLSKRSFAIQGVGKVGSAMLDLLSKEGVRKIFISDIDQKRLDEASAQYPWVQVVSNDSITKENVDVFIPCALGGVISELVAQTINTKAIVGSANNQLKTAQAGDILFERGICYAPDFVVNAGGLISVVHEFEQEKNPATTQQLDEKVDAIEERLRNILKESKAQNIPTHQIANMSARLSIDELYPPRK